MYSYLIIPFIKINEKKSIFTLEKALLALIYGAYESKLHLHFNFVY